VVGRLLCENRLSEEDLRGLREEKMNPFFRPVSQKRRSLICILNAIALRQLCATTRIVIIARENEWVKAEISGDGKLRSRTWRPEQKSPVPMPKPKRNSVAATRPHLRNRMPLFSLR
jgi:hypothetical protein